MTTTPDRWSYRGTGKRWSARSGSHGSGARAVRCFLPVSAPFHCALMEPAARAMAEALEGVEINPPAVPLVANVRARPVSDPATIRALLVEQVTGVVRWRESVAWMAGAGVTTFLRDRRGQGAVRHDPPDRQVRHNPRSGNAGGCAGTAGGTAGRGAMS